MSSEGSCAGGKVNFTMEIELPPKKIKVDSATAALTATLQQRTKTQESVASDYSLFMEDRGFEQSGSPANFSKLVNDQSSTLYRSVETLDGLCSSLGLIEAAIIILFLFKKHVEPLGFEIVEKERTTKPPEGGVKKG